MTRFCLVAVLVFGMPTLMHGQRLGGPLLVTSSAAPGQMLPLDVDERLRRAIMVVNQQAGEFLLDYGSARDADTRLDEYGVWIYLGSHRQGCHRPQGAPFVEWHVRDARVAAQQVKQGLLACIRRHDRR